ncbi:MAG: GumC family protein [Rhizobiaceae bacterium]|nr:GumC family protein [Rhizobiaceae bacterium]
MPLRRPRARPARGDHDATHDAFRPLVDVRTVIAAIIDTRALIGLLGAFGLALGVMFAMGIPKFYYSTVELLVDPRDLKISERELMPSGLPYDASLAIVENQTKIISSRRVLEATVDQLKLADDPEFNGEGLGAPSPVAMLMELIGGKDPDDAARRRELAVQSLIDAVSVSREQKTFIVYLTARSEVADKAALIANTMADVYLNAQQDIQTGAAQRASGELGGRLDGLRSDVEKAERAVEAYKAENELFDANGKLISDNEIELISTQLTRARERVAELRARADSARELTLDAVLSGAAPEAASSNLIAELRRGYAQKVQQRDALAQKLGSAHPRLQTAEAEVASAARGLETELRRLSQTAQIELQRAVQTEQQLASEQARFKSRQTDISERLVQLRELEREAAAQRAIYENFLLRARETGEQAGISTANTSIVSAAVPAIRAYGTSKKLVALGGLIGGLLLGTGLGVLRGIWRSIRAEPDDRADLQYDPTDDTDEASVPPSRMPQGDVNAPPRPDGPPPPPNPRKPALNQDQSPAAEAPPMYANLPQWPYAPAAFAPQQPQPMMQPVMPQMMAQPMAQMMAQPMAQMMAQPMPQMMAQPMAQMMAQPMAQMMAQPMAQMMAQPMPQMMAQPMAQMMAQMMAQPMAQMMAQPQFIPVPMPVPVAVPPQIVAYAPQQPVQQQPAQQQPAQQQPAQQAAPVVEAAQQLQPARGDVPRESAADHDTIRRRLSALRDGISLLAEKRDRLRAIEG